MFVNNHYKKLIWFAYLSALIMWSLCSYFEIAKYLVTGCLFARLINNRPCVLDFVNIYNASQLAKECLFHPINIYDPILQDQSVKQLVAPIRPEIPFFIQYPPYFFSLVLPLAFVPMPVAWLIWTALAAFLLVITIKANIKDIDYSKNMKAFIYAGAFCALPTWLSFELGQTSLLLLPLVSAYWLFLKGNKNFLAGLIASLISIKLQYIPFVGVIGLLLGKRDFLLGIISGMIALLAFAAITVGIPNIVNYPAALITGETSQALSGVSAEVMQNFRAMLILFVKEDSKLVHGLSLFLLAASIIAGVILWVKFYKNKKSSDETFDILAATTTLLLLISSPHAHTQDYLLSLLPCLWIYKIFSRKKVKTKAMKIALFLVTFYPPLSWVFYVFKEYIDLAYIKPFFALALILIILNVRFLTDSREQPE